MKRNFTTSVLLTTLFALCFSVNASAQIVHSDDWTLSMLRGSWKFHTFEDKWTLKFFSDHNLVIDRNDVRYMLLPGLIRVINGNDSTDYPYALNDNKLTLRLPDGSERTYKKTGGGEAEEKVKGILYAEIDSTGKKAHLSFDGKHSFNLTDEISEDIGVYRVEGGTIILALDDTTAYTTQIRSWNDNGSLDEVAFDGRLYATEKPSVPSVGDTPHSESSVSAGNTTSREPSPSFFEILGKLFFGGSAASQSEQDQPAAVTSTSPAPSTPAAAPSSSGSSIKNEPARKFGAKRPPNR